MGGGRPETSLSRATRPWASGQMILDNPNRNLIRDPNRPAAEIDSDWD